MPTEFGGEAGAGYPAQGPAGYDPAAPKADPHARIAHVEHAARESILAVEKAKFLREKVKWCYRVEGVNHFVKCKDVVNEYLAAVNGPEGIGAHKFNWT